jgi:hypothetical protein
MLHVISVGGVVGTGVNVFTTCDHTMGQDFHSLTPVWGLTHCHLSVPPPIGFGGLEHLKIETRLIERFASVMGVCV